MDTDITLLDTTLRDGMQGQGMSLSAREKVRVAHLLDDLGVSLIEAGFPGSNPKDSELFDLLSGESFENAQLVAFGMTRRRDIGPAEDPGLAALLASGAPVACIVGKTWALHLEKVTRVSREENVEMIEESVAHLVAGGMRVVYDAEHFFDAWREDRDYALECVRSAVRAGAFNVSLCDTNGSSLPDQIGEAVAGVVADLDGAAEVGIHTHNDAECAVAGSLAAVRAGATLVQGTINGIGERTGNANLVSIVPALELKMGLRVVGPDRLARLAPVSHLVDELLNRTPDPNQAYVGRNAFAHKGGMHAAGVEADARTFEHIDPARVGNHREVVVSELAGRGSVVARARERGIDLSDTDARRALEVLKAREHAGYQYEAAAASFDLLLRRESGGYQPLFRLESFRVIVEKREGGRVETEATIKIWVDGERYVRTAEGNGPVNALDRALREAIADLHPHLADIELTNYKVRILDESHGTGAVTRVLLDTTDGELEWGTIGVSENIIEASWEALVDSLEYAFQPEPSSPGAGRTSAGR